MHIHLSLLLAHKDDLIDKELNAVLDLISGLRTASDIKAGSALLGADPTAICAFYKKTFEVRLD